ncbi:hypothetical protein B0H67DRAFT_249611 [Lasiosphaeris hirsuta]|uniref:Secreted protein n=1 Tax=Lasiosphaeris hirsuta TaxID=260670 RepID=A0AA40AH51_9PEZI|nr:hypothetical protein B0H67DRAFT_249611 [Lasiosphaeris hirsuta]
MQPGLRVCWLAGLLACSTSIVFSRTVSLPIHTHTRIESRSLDQGELVPRHHRDRRERSVAPFICFFILVSRRPVIPNMHGAAERPSRLPITDKLNR